MKTIAIEYTLKYELSSSPNYKFTTCKKCFNVKTGRRIKQTLVGGSIGYVVNGKFKSLSSLRKELRKIKSECCPF